MRAVRDWGIWSVGKPPSWLEKAVDATAQGSQALCNAVVGRVVPA